MGLRALLSRVSPTALSLSRKRELRFSLILGETVAWLCPNLTRMKINHPS